MSIYHRFASLEHDEAFFKRQSPVAGASKKRPSRKSSKHKSKSTRSASNDSSTSEYGVSILIPPLGGQFRVSNTTGNWKNKRRNEYVNNDHTMIEGDFQITRQSPTARSKENTLQEWASIFPRSAYFTGHDKDLFGDIIIFIYENPETGRINTKSITKFGVTTYDNLILDSRSRFWPSCENLLPEYRRSNVRRAIAITNLKNYNKLSNNHFEYLELKEPWDETNAGSLANEMYLLTDKTPLDLGQKLLQLGLIQSHSVKSVLIDTVYDNYSDQTTEKIIEDNNRMVFLLGDQLDQLFDPLLEYSPEQMQINYNVLASDFKTPPMLLGNENISSIVAELISIQTNYTMGLVNLLQNFIIPLRIHVLSNASSTSASAQKASGIFKINQVFPPTIDEITRINCILHDSLNKAKYYGYMEIFKCLGMILPYFYKAFIRHEANLKNFSSRLNKFSQRNHKRIFENKKLNKGEYSVREIESVVSGSLFELPRLKLILKRLYDTIRSEMSTVRDSKTYSRAREKEEIGHINHYYHTALDVIDAFGGILPDENGENSIQKIDLKQRFFTPTGKILTELASKWPEELQYDWLTRKVVGIFELKNLKPLPDSIFDTDILIIFSDYLLFLTINDTKYYLKKFDDPQKSVSVSDILMHSLINEKPLPSLDIFPTMEVNGWCEINSVVASSYEATSTLNTEAQGDFLRFLSTKKYGFNSACKYSNFCKNYEILNTCEQENGGKIIEMITKSKVLQKTQSFHLFKSSANENTDLTLYSTAHNIDAYEVETCKSAFALFLNITIDEPKKYFDTHPDLYLIVNASFVSDETVQLVGFTRDGNYELDEIIPAQDLQKTLKKIISSNYEILFKSHNAITESLGNGYKNDLDYYLKVFTSYNSERLKMKEKQIEAERVAEENKRMQANEAKPKVAPTAVVENPKFNKKKSIISKFFRSFKKSNEETKVKTAPGQTPISKKISNTTIPKGSEVEYAHIYKPIPELKPHEHEQQTNDRVQRPAQLVNPKSRSPKSSGRPSFNESTRTVSRAVSIPQYSTETRYDQANLSQEDLQRLDGVRRFSQEGLPNTTKTRVISFKPEPEEKKEENPERELSEFGHEHDEYGNTYLPTPFTSRPAQHQRTISSDYSKSAIQHHSINAIRDYSRQISAASKYTGNSSYGQVENSPIFYDENLTRSTTEENVAALDSIEKTKKKSQSPSSIPLMDLDLPIEEFYIDGESNWTLLASRENSNLSQEVQKLKEEQQFIEHLPAVDQTERTISLRSVSEGQSTLDFGRNSTSVDQTGDLMEQFMAEFGPDDRKSLNEIFKARHGSSSTFEIPSNYFVRENREESMQSLTSTQIIEEFKNTIDFDSGIELGDPDFPVSRTISRNTSKGSNSSDSRNSYISSISDRTKDSSDSYRSNGNGSRPSFGGFGSRANPSNATLNSSDEEYYSPNEFDFGNSIYKMINDVQARSKQSLLLSQKKQALLHHNNSSSWSLAPPTYSPYSSSPNSIRSNSSEATVTNDYSVSKPKLASEPSEQYFTRLASKDESIAFLSDLLNGSINL